MRITTFKLNNFKIIAYSKPTRVAFKHECELSGGTYVSTKICYLNRTWESYTFQSVICKALAIALESEQKALKRAIRAKESEDAIQYKQKLVNRLKRALKHARKSEPKHTSVYVNA